jgi:hypothetical protein
LREEMLRVVHLCIACGMEDFGMWYMQGMSTSPMTPA